MAFKRPAVRSRLAPLQKPEGTPPRAFLVPVQTTPPTSPGDPSPLGTTAPQKGCRAALAPVTARARLEDGERGPGFDPVRHCGILPDR